MRRRSTASKSRGHHAPGQKPGKARTRRASTADLEEQLVRVRRERDEEREQHAATSEILDVISRSPTNLQPVFDAIVQNAARLCHASNASVYRIEADRLRHVANYGGMPIVKLGETRPITERSLSGKAVIGRKVIHIHDALAVADTELLDSRGAIKREKIRTSLAIPLMRGDTLHGVMTLRRDVVRDFTDEQIDLLKDFAAQAVIAIENTRLLNELRDSLQQQTAAADVLRVISSSPGELQPVFEAMLENGTRLCEAKFGIMWLREGDKFRCSALHNTPAEFVEARRREPVISLHPGSPMARVVQSKQVVHIADMATDAVYAEGNRPLVDLVKFGGARTLLVVPMLKNNEAIGTINIYRQEVRPFTEKQIELVKNFAAQGRGGSPDGRQAAARVVDFAGREIQAEGHGRRAGKHGHCTGQ
jgi:two-component system NtrC family sensor kinase